MRTRSFVLSGALLLGASRSAQAAWGFGSGVSRVGTPVDAAAPEPAAAPDEHIPFDFDDLVVGNSKPSAPSPAPTAAPVAVDHPSEPLATPTPRAPYEGRSYSWGTFTLRPAEYKFEAGCLAVVISYLALSFLGAAENRSHASAWFASNNVVLRDEFSGVGFGSKPFADEGGDEAFSYATGRRGVSSVWVKVRTKARHDLFTSLYHTIRGILDYHYVSGEDRVTIDFKLDAPQGSPGSKFTFAVVDRTVLRQVRDSRWDMATFTTVTETTAGVDPSLIVMSENGEVSKAVLHSDTGLLQAIGKGAPHLEWLESLVISDVPAKAPKQDKPRLPDEYHLILTLRLPPKHKVDETNSWLSLACNIIDVLHLKPKLLPEVQIAKLRKRRTEALGAIVAEVEKEKKLLAQDDKEDAAALKRRLEREKEEAKLQKMTKAERVKYLAKREETRKKEALKQLTKTKRK